MAKKTQIKSFVVCESGAAKLCGLSASTLARYRKVGYGPEYIAIPSPDGKVDKSTGEVKTRYLYEEDDVLRWLRSFKIRQNEGF